MNIGFIGLGNLGTPIAINLLESGNDLYVYNRTISKTDPLRDKGAVVCKTAGEVARQCEIVFTMVADDRALDAICEGKDGLFENLRDNSAHVSMSTILPATAKKIAEQHYKLNQQYLASPVFGRPEAAAARKLNFVVSGEEALIQKLTPYLKQAGATGVWEFGNDITAANTVKLCGNFLIAAAIEAISESIGLAGQSGVDTAKMWSMITQTLFNAPAYVNYGNLIIQRKFEPASFTMQLGLKDVNLVLEQAKTSGQEMPVAEVLKKNFTKLIGEGKQDLDWSALALASIKN